jgi:hypothetical protein
VVKCPFKGTRFPPSKYDIQLESNLFRLKSRINEYQRPTTRTNITRDERTALGQMKNDDLMYYQSDKGGEFTIIDRDKYIDLAIQHLNNTNVYDVIPRDNTASFNKELTTEWKTIAKSHRIPMKFITRLISPAPRCQRFYHVLKTHKAVLAIRPIVSGKGGPTERISWLLATLLTPLLQHAPAHLTNTKQLLDKINSTPELEGCIPASLDVTSLYTSVPVLEAIDTVIEYIHRYQLPLYGFTSNNILRLLRIVLMNNYFQFGDNFYKQKFGLAMGSRLAPVLAILTLDRLEKNSYIQQFQRLSKSLHALR